MCVQPIVYSQHHGVLSTIQLGWLPVPYNTQQKFGMLNSLYPSIAVFTLVVATEVLVFFFLKEILFFLPQS